MKTLNSKPNGSTELELLHSAHYVFPSIIISLLYVWIAKQLFYVF